jgi:hypothetical protein
VLIFLLFLGILVCWKNVVSRVVFKIILAANR